MAKSNQQLTLLELQERIRETMENSFLETLWLSASIAQISVNPSGHCYITLIEMDNTGMVARANSVIWASSYRMIKPFFESSTGESLCEGMKILVQVRVQYSELYGLSLIITDIDPAFTIGEEMLEKQRTIARLESEGMMDLNSSRIMPALPSRIAVVSSETAAGYGDFMNHLYGNEFGYRFTTTLFSAPLQGRDAPAGIIAALDRIAERESEFDAVVIMRGGGSATDLSCFDDYGLAINIAQFPLPVLTAVGHERDYHIADMVSYQSVKTPTAAADFFVDIFSGHEANVNSLATRLAVALKGKQAEAMNRLDVLHMRLSSIVSLRMVEEKEKIAMLEMRTSALDPTSTLARGFAVIVKDGRRVTSLSDFENGDRLSLIMNGGSVQVEVLSKKGNNADE